MSAGRLLGYEKRHNEAPVMFMLRYRRPDRYGGGGGRSPKLPPLRRAPTVAPPVLPDAPVPAATLPKPEEA